MKEIKGDKNVTTCTESKYTLEFDKNFTGNIVITMTPPNIGFFKESLEAGRPSSFMNTYGSGKKTFDFTIYWAKEYSNVFISAAVEGTDGYHLDNIKVACKPCTIEPSLSIVTPGQELVCSTLYKFENKGRIKPEWYFDNTFFQKIRQADSQTSTSIYLKALKAGITNIGVKVSMNNDDKRIEEDPVKGEVQIQIKQPYTLKPNKSSVCVGNFITYEIENLQGNERIVWEALRHTSLYSGQGTKSATFQVTEQGYIEIAATISQNNESITLNSNEVWAGKPTINTDLETSHVMTERNPVIIDASNEFFHYKGGISYAIEGEYAEYVTVTETDKKFKVETTIPGNKRGEIKLRLKVSNDCGEVSNLHTIAYDTLPGLEPAKAIDLFSAKEHEFTCGRTYDMAKYVGDLQTFQMFFTFTLERRATIMYIRPFCTEEKCLGFRIYDRKDEDLETPLYTHEASDTYMTIENVPQGEYMMVLDVERDHSDKLEIISNGYIGGSSPTRPYVIEPDENGFEFSDCRNTETYYDSFYYKNEQGESVGSVAGTNNTYYILTLEKPMQLILHTAGSKVSTEFHIMQGEPYDWKVLYHETGGNYRMEEIQADPEVSEELKSMILNSLWAGQTYVKRIFPAGEYRFVLNGIKKSNGGLYNGDLNFNVIGQTVTENSFDTAFDLGSFTKHEFNINAFLSDIQAHKNLKIQKLYFRFHTEKNVCFILNALSESEFLPIVFYNSDKKQIATSDTGGEINIKDMAGGTYYFIVDISQAQGDKLTIEGKGIFRGRDPYFSYNLGTYDKDFTISDTIDTADGGFYEIFKYTDENGNLIYTDEPAANHVYYKITLQKEMQLIIHTTYSELPLTELHIMKGEPFGWNVLYYKDYGCGGIENDPDIPDEIKQNIAFGQICVKINLPAGEHKLVLNGTKRTNGGIRNGVLVTNVIGKTV